MTREEIKSKFIKEDAFLTMDTVNDYFVIHKDSFDNALDEAYTEGAKSATPWGGHNPNHYQDFIKQD